MGAIPIVMSASGGRQLKELSRRLKDAGRGDLRRELRSNIKDAGKPVVADLQSAVMRVEMKSSRGGVAHPDRSTGLRRRIARATTLSVTANGIRLKVVGRRVDARYPKLAKYTDASIGNYARWRHPVLGNRDVWVTQSGSPWWFVTIARHRSDFRRACLKAMNDIAAKIT